MLHLKDTYSSQYDCNAVIIPKEATKTDGNDIVDFAYDTGAIYDLVRPRSPATRPSETAGGERGF